MTLGVRAPGRHWKHRWALSVLNTALGGGLSSRLFQQIREERGLAYTVYSTVDTFADTGALSVYTACLPERFGDVVSVTTEVLQTVARDGITDDECRIAKGSLRGGLVLGLEDSGSRMNRIGRSELNYGEHRSIGHTLAQIDSVTLDEVNAVARRVLGGPYGAAVLGPYTDRNANCRIDFGYSDKMEIEGKVAVVTGGGSGIGRALATALAGAGAHVVVGDIDRVRAEQTADSISARGHAGGRTAGRRQLGSRHRRR